MTGDLVITVKFDRDARTYVAGCAALGVWSAGATPEDALVAGLEALALWTKHCQRRGILARLLETRLVTKEDEDHG